MSATRIFISYAHADGADLAQRLQADLSAPDCSVWLDVNRLRGGMIWTYEIEQAIDSADVVLALMSDGSYKSEICRAEQLRSLRKGKCVIPLLAVHGSDIPLHLEAKQYISFANGTAYADRLQSLRTDIADRVGIALRPEFKTTRTTYVTAPPIIAKPVERTEALRAMRDALFATDSSQSIAITAVHGMGGIGKTVLAQMLLRDQVIQDAFPDGLIWITVGRDPAIDWTAKLREIAKVVGGAIDPDLSPETNYKSALRDKAALVVIDDIWDKTHLEHFLADSPRSRFLFTTRDRSIAPFVSAHEYRVDLLDDAQARELLAVRAGRSADALPPAAAGILRECNRLPLAVSMIGSMLNGADDAAWLDTVELLRKADISAIEAQLPPGQRSFFQATEVSVAALPEDMRQRYLRLAVLLDDMSAELPVLRTLWDVDEPSARRIVRYLEGKSLLQQSGPGAVQIHDLQLNYVQARFDDKALLRLIHAATRLSAHAVENNPSQYASHLVGRLLAHCGTPAIQRFVNEVAAAAPRPWLRPLYSVLHPPGTPLLRTLTGHSSGIAAVAITPDGRRAVSGSWDKTLKLWDLDSGREIATLEGHSDWVDAAAITSDGRRAVSASGDRTLKLWDLESTADTATVEGHSGIIPAVAITPDGGRAVSASWDKTLKLWDLVSAREIATFGWHPRAINAVAITPDGRRVVSGSEDGTLKIWDLYFRRQIATLKGHSGIIPAVAITPDGGRAVSASWDKTLKLWDLVSAREIATLEGHSDIVYAVAITPDGGRAVSGSEDKTLKLWDLDSGREIATLEGHSDSVYAVAITPDGGRAVSGSEDKTLKLWDLDSGREVATLGGHSDRVNVVAITPGGRYAASGSWDFAFRIWNLDQTSCIATFTCDAGVTRILTV